MRPPVVVPKDHPTVHIAGTHLVLGYNTTSKIDIVEHLLLVEAPTHWNNLK